MRTRRRDFILLFIGCVVFLLLGHGVSSLVSVASKDWMAARKLTATALKIRNAAKERGICPSDIDIAVKMGLCEKEDVIDAWGEKMLIQRSKDGKLLLVSCGDPAVRQKNPCLSSRLYCFLEDVN